MRHWRSFVAARVAAELGKIFRESHGRGDLRCPVDGFIEGNRAPLMKALLPGLQPAASTGFFSFCRRFPGPGPSITLMIDGELRHWQASDGGNGEGAHELMRWMGGCPEMSEEEFLALIGQAAIRVLCEGH